MTESDKATLGETIRAAWQAGIAKNKLDGQPTADPTRNKIQDAAAHAAEGSRYPNPARRPPPAK